MADTTFVFQREHSCQKSVDCPPLLFCAVIGPVSLKRSARSQTVIWAVDRSGLNDPLGPAGGEFGHILDQLPTPLCTVYFKFNFLTRFIAGESLSVPQGGTSGVLNTDEWVSSIRWETSVS